MKVDSIGESALIRRICRKSFYRSDVIAGIGDDTAVVKLGLKDQTQLLTVDNVVEGIHYRKGTPSKLIGRKALARSLSDIAAMGGTAKYALVTLGIPSGTQVKTVDDIYKGFFKLASEYQVQLIGGDVTRSPKALFLSVVVIGSMEGRRPVLRRGANPGDFIFVTGTLGGSLKEHHLIFNPRIREGQWLSKKGIPSSMIDISDGLMVDLKHLLDESKVGALLNRESIPISMDAVELAKGRTSAAFKRVLEDGEDYELLFTTRVNPDLWVKEFRNLFKVPLTCIGKITKGTSRIYFENKKGYKKKFDVKGFAHF